MHAFVLQDWTTIRGTSGATIVQGEDGWLDLSAYQDVVFWLDCREVTGASNTLNYQTSPTRDETLFQNMLAAGITMAAASTPVVSKALLSGAAVPIARYLRWSITGTAVTPWDATFRILIAANSPGM